MYVKVVHAVSPPQDCCCYPSELIHKQKSILERVKRLLNGSRTGVIMHYLAYFEQYWIFPFPSHIGFIVVYVNERFVLWRVLLSRESPWAPTSRLFIPWYLLY